MRIDTDRNFIMNSKKTKDHILYLFHPQIINLAENKITSIDKQAFTDLYLAVVNISHNELSSIEPGAFQNCNNMTLLDLSHNRLKEIDKRAFDENTYASVFQVSYNEFTDLAQVIFHFTFS